MRIQKVIAAIGICSRRNAEAMIVEGRVKVNGKTAKLGDKVTGKEALMLDNKIIKYQMPSSEQSRLILMNKPTGWMCSHKQQTDHPLVYDLLPKLKSGRWLSIGRLDLNSHGLLLFTNNGDLLQRILHPKQALKRVYKVRIRGELDPKMQAKLKQGILIDGVSCKFSEIEKLKVGASNSTWKISLHEGRNREIRQMLAAIDCQVNSLKRVAYGPFLLPHDLPPGKWFEIPFDVVKAKL